MVSTCKHAFFVSLSAVRLTYKLVEALGSTKTGRAGADNEGLYFGGRHGFVANVGAREDGTNLDGITEMRGMLAVVVVVVERKKRGQTQIVIKVVLVLDNRSSERAREK